MFNRYIGILLWALVGKYVIAEPAINRLDFTLSATNQFGKIAVRESQVDGDTLFLNQQKIDLRQGGYSFRLGLIAQINFESHVVYILWGGSGGTMDMDNNMQCKFINITTPKKYQISSLTYCPIEDKEDTITTKGNGLIVNFYNVAAYAESSDIGKLIYDIRTNKIKLIQNTKNDSYYKAKYAKFTPQQIVNEAIKDNNFDKQTNTVMTCHMCGMYGTKYCFKFQSLENPIHDKYYNILKKSCGK